jgi:hypothetical protein
MAIAFAQMKRDWSYPSSSSGQTLTFSSNCTNGSFMIAEVSTFTGSPGSTIVSDPTNGTWNFIAATVGGYGTMSTYWVVNTSTTTLSVSWSSSLTFPSFQICEFTGTKTSSPIDNSSSNTGVSGVAVTASGANELIIGVPIPISGGDMETTAGWTSTDPGDSSGQPMIYAIQSAPGSYTPTFTASGGVQSISVFPASSAPVTHRLLSLLGCGI